MATKSNVPTQTKEVAKRQSKKQPGQRFNQLIGDASNTRDASARMLLLDQNRTMPIVETSKTVRGPQPIPAPDIAYFARRGGLPSTARTYPYKLASEPFDYIRESSNGTPSVQIFTLLGLEKVFSDVEAFRKRGAAEGVKVDEKLVRETFKELDFIEGPIPTGSPSESAQEVLESSILKRWPDLTQWPAKKQARRGRYKDKFRQDRLNALCEADRLGANVVKHLDKKLARIPLPWQARGCPRTWEAAYANPKWKLRVQKEISHLRRCLQQSPK